MLFCVVQITVESDNSVLQTFDRFAIRATTERPMRAPLRWHHHHFRSRSIIRNGAINAKTVLGLKVSLGGQPVREAIQVETALYQGCLIPSLSLTAEILIMCS